MMVDLQDLTAEQFFSMSPDDIFLYAAQLFAEQIRELKSAISDEWFVVEISTGGEDLFTLEQWVAAYQRAEDLYNKQVVLSNLYFFKLYNMSPFDIKRWVANSRVHYEERKQNETRVLDTCKKIKRGCWLKGIEWIELIIKEIKQGA